MELGRGKAYKDIGFKLPFNIQRNSYNFIEVLLSN